MGPCSPRITGVHALAATLPLVVVTDAEATSQKPRSLRNSALTYKTRRGEAPAPQSGSTNSERTAESILKKQFGNMDTVPSLNANPSGSAEPGLESGAPGVHMFIRNCDME